MQNKTMGWADALLTLWVVVVGLVYFGGLFIPAVALLTGNFAAFYALMLLAGALALARKFLHPNHENSPKNTSRTKNRK